MIERANIKSGASDHNFARLWTALRQNASAVDGVLAAAFVLLAALLIISTYGRLTQTYDEPFHIATGLQWLQTGRYTIERLHPPIGRIMAALPLYLSGRRLSKEMPTWDEAWSLGNQVLQFDNSYTTNLSLARSGQLVFFFATAFAVWLWSRSLLPRPAPLLAVLLFVTLPPVLAHSGLATTDMAGTAGCFAALMCFAVWLRRPTAPQTILLGVATGIALTSKFSNFLFLPVCMAAMTAARLVPLTRTEVGEIARPKILYRVGLAASVAFVVMWGVYRFNTVALTTVQERPHNMIDRIVGAHGPAHALAYRFVEAPIFPLSEITRGLQELRTKDRDHEHAEAFFLGAFRNEPIWYYFPVVLFLKTPIPFLVFAIAGAWATWRFGSRHNWELFGLAFSVIAVVLSTMPVHVHEGVRHVLVVYPMLSIVAANGAMILVARRPKLFGALVLLFALWQIRIAVHENPDYVAYFNEFVGSGADRFVADSNLDWGQDLGRLARTLRSRNIRHIDLAYLGSADLTEQRLPDFHLLKPNVEAFGWVAVSVGMLRTRGYRWLENYKPVERIGKSILLFQIPSR